MVKADETWGRQLARRVGEELRRRIAEGVPHGELLKKQTEVAAAVGRKRTYFEKMTRRTGNGGKVEIGILCDVLAYLRINPGDFFADVFGEPTDLPGRPSGAVPAATEAALKLSQTPRKIVTPLTPEDLIAIDASRYDNPQGAVREAERAIERTPRELLPKLLGILASCYRMTLDLDAAEHTVRAALELAPQHSFSLRGELLQRLGFISAERGQFKVALRLTEQAMANYSTATDGAGLGRCLVDRGVYFFHLDRFEDGILAQKAALAQLPGKETLHRFAGLHGLSLLHERIGEVGIAKDYSRHAAQLVDAVGSANAIRHTWLLASIARRLGKLEDAERDIRKVVDFFRPISAADSVVATLDLVHILLLQDRFEDAKTEALRLIPLAKETKSRPLKAEIWELNRHGRSGLHVARLKEIRAAMKQAARSRPRPG